MLVDFFRYVTLIRFDVSPPPMLLILTKRDKVANTE